MNREKTKTEIMGLMIIQAVGLCTRQMKTWWAGPFLEMDQKHCSHGLFFIGPKLILAHIFFINIFGPKPPKSLNIILN